PTVIHIEAVKTSVIGNDRKISFGFKIPYRCFYTQYVFRIFRLTCNQVFASQIHIAYGGRENQMRSFIVGNFHAVRFYFAQGKRCFDAVLCVGLYGKAEYQGQSPKGFKMIFHCLKYLSSTSLFGNKEDLMACL